VTRGEGLVHHHGQNWPLTAGTLHLIPCFCTCDYSCPGPFDLYYAAFTARLAGGNDLFTLWDFDFSVEAQPREKQLFRRLLEVHPDLPLVDYDPYKPAGQIFPARKDGLDINDTASAIEGTGILRQLLSAILRTAQPRTEAHGSAARRLEPVFDLIEKNLDKPIGLEEMAASTGLRPTYFSDLFHRTFGERPTVFVNRRRIEKAQLLLISSDLHIQEIAERCGFRNKPYFTRTFRKFAGEPPLRYRRTHQAF
jgi:AraC-like DNA-binding protein